MGKLTHSDGPSMAMIAAQPDMTAVAMAAVKIVRPWIDGGVTYQEWNEAFEIIKGALDTSVCGEKGKGQ